MSRNLIRRHGLKSPRRSGCSFVSVEEKQQLDGHSIVGDGVEWEPSKWQTSIGLP